MKDIVYVTGHRNPDSDSICSAIGYAYFYNKTTRGSRAEAVRIGNINNETQYILDYFKVEEPRLLKTVKLKVEDLDYDRTTMFSSDLTLKTAWDLMKQQNTKSAPILDENQHMLGLLSTTNIIQGFMDEWDSDTLAKGKTPIVNIIDTLQAKVLTAHDKHAIITGNLIIAAMDPTLAEEYIHQGDVVIVGGGRFAAIDLLLEKKVSLIILTGGYELTAPYIEKARDAKVSVITTQLDSYRASQIIVQAVPVEYVMQKGNILTFTTDDLLEDVKDEMSKSRFRSYPVVDLSGRVVGAMSRFQLINEGKKKVIQVDHNERGQSIDGLEQAEIIAIIDHHRVADIQTTSPIYFRNEPLGSTATIVAKCFDEQELEMPKEIAGVLLGAIISDTLLFKSPTSTPQDTKYAKRLAKIADVDIVDFAQEMFKVGTSLKGKTVEQIFKQDFKKFMVGEFKVGIGQVTTMDIEGFMEFKDDMLRYMKSEAEAEGYAFTLLLLTDIINSGSQLFAAGRRKDIVEAAFNVKLVDDTVYVPGILSRKKQVIPPLTNAIERE